jgi:hypothetical protein
MISSNSLPPPPPSPYGGAAYPAPQQQQRRKWSLKRTIIVAVAAALLLVALFIAGIVTLIFGFMRSSEPYKHAVDLATHDTRVQTRLGPPVKVGWLLQGNIREVNDAGTAELSIPVQGSVDKGTLYVFAKRAGGRWDYQTLEVHVEGGPVINLLPPGQSTSQEK